jgi:group I intron endonuclease
VSNKYYGIVYIHTCKPTGKVYIGKTTQKESRRYRNGKAYQTCVYFQAAIDKYGWENFDHKILAVGENAEQLKSLEEQYIREYDSSNPSKGFNIKKISDGHEYLTDEIKEKIRQAQLNHNKKLKEAGIVKISPNRREHTVVDGVEGKLCTGTEPNHWVPLTSFGTKPDTWDGLLHACRECRKLEMRQYRKLHPPKKLSPEEFQASYKNRGSSISEAQKRRFLENPSLFKVNAKTIKRTDLTTGEVKIYSSALAAKAEGFDNTYISQCCTGKKTSYRGYKWEFVQKETGSIKTP